MDALQRTVLDVPVSIPGPVEDPFDPRAVAVDAHIVTPSGRTLLQPCFFGQPHERRVEGGRERWVPTAAAGFALRVALDEPGRHAVEIHYARDGGGAHTAQSFAIDVAPSRAPGPVRVTAEAPRRLVREDGAPVVPVGMNLCWWISPDPTVQMERVLARMAGAGMSWARLWLTHFGEGLTIEWDAAHPSGQYAGLGRYSLAAAAKLDSLFSEAGRRGIDVQLVLWQHSQLASPSHSAWAENPYAASRGGPCASSADFFSHPEAVRLSDQRLRYLVARYGAFPSLFAWEVFNEMDLVLDAPLDVVARWCADRVRTIRSLDAHRHLVTTSQAFPPSLVPPVAAHDDAYDLVQLHAYADDLVDALAREGAALAGAAAGKPTLAAEVGLGAGGEADRAHPDGTYLHDATWAAFASGFAGGAMPWWWDSAIDAHDWYGRQSGAARFARAVAIAELGTPRADLRVQGAPHFARALGRVGAQGALAWVWLGPTKPADGAVLVVPGLPDREWLVEQWDTATGQPARGERVRTTGNLLFPLRTSARDVAVTVRVPPHT